MRGWHLLSQVIDAYLHCLVFIPAVSQAVHFNTQRPLVVVSCQNFHYAADVYDTLTTGDALPEVPLLRRATPPGTHILDMGCMNVRRKQLSFCDRIFEQAQRVAGIKVHPQVFRPHALNERRISPAVKSMWFSIARITFWFSATLTASVSSCDSRSICGPVGSCRKRRLLPTMRITGAPRALATPMCRMRSWRASELRPPSRPSGCPQAKTRSRLWRSSCFFSNCMKSESKQGRKQVSRDTPSAPSSIARSTKSVAVHRFPGSR